jgi:ADP-heptose:LPS heptosyltransferase
MHLAAFVGIPVVAIFGPTDHIVNEPYKHTPHIIIRKETECSPCRKKDCSKRLCMKGITEENVIRAVKIMLDSFKNKKNCQ